MFFVDAAHLVFGTFLCGLWPITRVFIRAAAGRQRFNVLGAWNAITRQSVSVTDTTAANTDTMVDLLRRIAAENLVGPVTVVPDNARYQLASIPTTHADELASLMTLRFQTLEDVSLLTA